MVGRGWVFISFVCTKETRQRKSAVSVSEAKNQAFWLKHPKLAALRQRMFFNAKRLGFLNASPPKAGAFGVLAFGVGAFGVGLVGSSWLWGRFFGWLLPLGSLPSGSMPSESCFQGPCLWNLTFGNFVFCLCLCLWWFWGFLFVVGGALFDGGEIERIERKRGGKLKERGWMDGVGFLFIRKNVLKCLIIKERGSAIM